MMRRSRSGVPVVIVIVIVIVLALGCSGGAAPAATSTEALSAAPASHASDGSEVSAPAAAPIETWWTDDLPEEADAQGLAAHASLTGRRDGVLAGLNGTDLFPTMFAMTTLFADDHAAHATMPEADVQWRFSLRAGANEASMRVPAEAASAWMGSPPMLVIHPQGRRWPSAVLVAAGRRELELRATFVLGDEAPATRRPVVVTDADPGPMPVLFLRCPDAEVHVALNGEGTEMTASGLRMVVLPLTERVRPGANTMTLTHHHVPAGGDAAEDDAEADEAQDAATAPTIEWLLLVGDRTYPGRAVLAAEPVITTVAFEIP